MISLLSLKCCKVLFDWIFRNIPDRSRGWSQMGKNKYGMGSQSKRTSAYDGVGGKVLPF